MKIEYFNKKRPNFKKLVEFGFQKEKDKYIYSNDIMNGDFNLNIEVTLSGYIKTKVIEKSSKEEYTLHLVHSAQGTFVGQIREEYEKILNLISDNCFEAEIFQSKEAKQIITYIEKKYADKLEYLWPKFPNNAISRRKDNKKWYLAILTVKKNKFGFVTDEMVEVLDLRSQPKDIPYLLKTENIYPGYHMNKKHWITILLDGSMPVEEIFERIDKSYDLALK